jgi:hypothetical protein
MVASKFKALDLLVLWGAIWGVIYFSNGSYK